MLLTRLHKCLESNSPVIHQTAQMSESNPSVQGIDQNAQMSESNLPLQVIDQPAQMSESNPSVHVIDQTVQMSERVTPTQVLIRLCLYIFIPYFQISI